jgi:Effector-associated domain 2
MQPDSTVERARPSGFRAIFVCDIVGFGERAGRDRVQEYLHLALYTTVKAAFDASGIRFDECYHEDRGDGVMVVLPAEADAALLVFPLIEHLSAELRRANELASDVASMRLRVALHCGRMSSDAEGLVGTAVNHVFRLLDAPGFKQAMKESAATVGVLASAEFHTTVIRDGRGAIDPGQFRPLEVRVKETRTTAWIRVPGAAPAPVPDEAGEAVVPRPRPPGPSDPGPHDGRRRDGHEDTPLPTLFELVDRILAIPLMAAPEGRDHVVGALRQEIAIRIQRSARPNLDMHAIVRTCLDFPGGLEEFLAVVRAFAGDSSHMRDLDDAIAQITRRRD